MPDLNEYPQYQPQTPYPETPPQGFQQNQAPYSAGVPAQEGQTQYQPPQQGNGYSYGNQGQTGQIPQQSPQQGNGYPYGYQGQTGQVPQQPSYPQGNGAAPSGFPGYTYEAPSQQNTQPSYGAPTPAPQKKRHLWKVLVPVCSVVVVLVVLAAVFIPKLLTTSSPQERLLQSFPNTVSALFDNPNSPTSAFSSMGKALQKGKISFDFQMEENQMTYTPAVGIGGSLTSDASQKAGLLDLHVAYAGEDLLGASLYYGPDQISLSLPAAFGDTAYGFSPQDIKGQMENSPWMQAQGLNPDDAGEIDELQKILDVLFAKSSTEDSNTLKELQDELYTVFMEDFSKIEPEEENTSVTVCGQDVNATLMTYTFEEDQVIDLFTHMLEALADSDNLDSLFSMGGLGEILEGNAPESFDSSLDEFRDSLRQAADSFADSYSGELTAQFAINSQNQLILMDITMKPGEEDGDISSVNLRGEFGPDFSGESGFMVEILIEDSYGDTSSMRLESQDTLDGTQYKNETSLIVERYGSSTQLDFTTEWDKSSGNFSFAMTIPSMEASFDSLTAYGTLTGDDTSCSLDLENISLSSGGENVFTFSLSLSSDTNATLEKPSMKNIFELTEDELMDLGSNVQNAFSGLIGSTYGTFY